MNVCENIIKMKSPELGYFVTLFFYFVANGPLASTSGTVDNAVTFRKADATLEFDTFKEDDIRDISFQFKTTVSDGSMIYGTGDTENRFIEIKMKNEDTIQFLYNSGSSSIGMLEYKHNNSLDNDVWHTVHVVLDPGEARLSVDNVPEVVHNKTITEVKRLHNMIIGASVDYSDGFVGCIGDLKINSVLVDMQGELKDHRVTYSVTAGCVKTTKCASNPCFNGGLCLDDYSDYTCDCTATPYGGSVCSKEIGVSLQPDTYIRFNALESLLETGFYNFSIGFVTRKKQGILLQIRDERNTETFSIMLNNNGGVKCILDIVWERYELNTWVDGKLDVSDGEPHEVLVKRERNGRLISIQIDTFDPVVAALSAFTNPVFPENQEYMFIGSNGKTREDSCGFEEITHEPEPMELRPYKPSCGNQTLTDLRLGQGVDMSNEHNLEFTISKSNNTLGSDVKQTLSITCTFNVTNAKLLYYIVIRRETSPGSGIVECIATIDAESTNTSTLNDQMRSDKGFVASGSLDTFASSRPFMRLEIDAEKLTSGDIGAYTCEAAYKYSTKDALAISRKLVAVTNANTVGVVQEVQEIKEVVIQCPLSKNIQYPTWTGPDGLASPLTQDETVNEPGIAWVNNKDLKIERVMLKHDGNYTCKDANNNTATVELDVQYFSAWAEFTAATPENTRTELTCTVHSNPRSKIVPHIFTHVRPGDEPEKQDAKITFHPCESDPSRENRTKCSVTAVMYVSKEDNGLKLDETSCAFEYKNSTVLTLYPKVRFLFPPIMVNISGNRQIRDSDRSKLTLTCSTDSSNPVSSLVWRKGTSVVANENRVISSSYQSVVVDAAYHGQNITQYIDIEIDEDIDNDQLFCCASHRSETYCDSITIDYRPSTASAGTVVAR